MLEWLLTGDNLFIFGALGGMASLILFSGLYSVCPNDSKLEKRIENTLVTLSIIVPILILGASLYIKSQISVEYIHDSEWKVIYTNDIDAKVKISLESDKDFLNLKLPLTVVAGEEMRNMYEYITNTAKGELTASKGNSEETKKIHLDKSNIITTGPLSNTSKITKVEYRPIIGQRNTAFGHYGETEKADVDGEIRITVETNDEDTKQLKALFEQPEKTGVSTPG